MASGLLSLVSLLAPECFSHAKPGLWFTAHDSMVRNSYSGSSFSWSLAEIALWFHEVPMLAELGLEPELAGGHSKRYE